MERLAFHRKTAKLLLCPVDPEGVWGDPTSDKPAEKSHMLTIKGTIIINGKKLNESSVGSVMAYPCNEYIEVLCSSIRSYSQSLQ